MIPRTSKAPEGMNTIHQFKVQGLDGGVIDFAAFKGKKILLVNTASKCGYTPQYEELQKLYSTYKNKLKQIIHTLFSTVSFISFYFNAAN